MICCDCKRDLPASAFGARKNRPKGRMSYCRECMNKRWRKWAYGEAA